MDAKYTSRGLGYAGRPSTLDVCSANAVVIGFSTATEDSNVKDRIFGIETVVRKIRLMPEARIFYAGPVLSGSWEPDWSKGRDGQVLKYSVVPHLWPGDPLSKTKWEITWAEMKAWYDTDRMSLVGLPGLGVMMGVKHRDTQSFIRTMVDWMRAVEIVAPEMVAA